MKAKRAPVASAAVFENTALAISENIRVRHLPYGTIMDPICASVTSDEIASYTHTGDSALWTGMYAAAEAFRFRVTRDAGALDNLGAALSGIKGLVDITGQDILARVAVPDSSPYGEAIQKEEGGHGVFAAELAGQKHFWIGNTTRDQYSGVLFGLGVALDLVADVRKEVSELISRLVNYLVDHAWAVRMPSGKVSTVFLQRPDQQLAFLQIARTADAKFATAYNAVRASSAALIVVPLAYELLDDHHSYFKFNLDTINLYSLLHLESPDSPAYKLYRKAYDVMRRTTDDHQNAHFNMIDRAIRGADSKRDQETVQYLQSWLQRPRRDVFVDLRGKVEAAGEDKARQVIPVEQRPTTDFLWQRSPFLLYGGGVGLVEGSGLDFILPYWMARYYNII
jgi:hypothetical protein